MSRSPKFGFARIMALVSVATIGISCLAFAAVSIKKHQNPHGKKPTGAPYTLNFTLSAACSTSAGIYGSNGNLVRTLWGNRPMNAGVFQQVWDGNDDYGNPVSPDSFTAKLLTHNVTANWDGTIGNSSTYQTGISKIHGIGAFCDIASTGNEVYLLREYNEGQDEVTKFSTGAPGIFSNSGGAAVSMWYTAISMATDGKHMYLGCAVNLNYSTNPEGHVIAYDLNETTGAWTFSGITPIAGTAQGDNNSAKWLVTGPMTADPTSLAVQTKGNVLAVAEQALGQVVFYDKLGGNQLSGAQGVLASLGKVSTIRWSPDERTLWASVGSNVTGWQFNGSAWVATYRVSGSSFVRSLAVNPKDGSVAILYSGTDQQVRAYTPSGTFLYAIGAKGGYSSGPAVNDNKFMIPVDTGGWYDNMAVAGGLAFQSNGELWVEDRGNERALRFPITSRHLAVPRKDAMMCMANPGTLAVDPNNPTRIIGNYLEYSRDFTQPLMGLGSSPTSWTLVKNWGYPYSQLPQVQNNLSGITQMLTASNGRTYAVSIPYSSHQQDLVELTPSGIRDIGPYNDMTFQSDFSSWNIAGAGTSTETVLVRRLTGFDSNNNPVWGPQTQYCSMPLGPGQPTYNWGYAVTGGMPIDVLADGSIASFNTTGGPTDFNTHYLGFVKPGATDFWVKTAKGALNTPLLHDGSMPMSPLPNPGLIPDLGGRTLGNMVVVFCNGEFFDAAQSNQILLYDGSGLFITDFGTRSGSSDFTMCPSGKSGNFYGNAFVMCADGNPRIFHNDESSHAGIHEWTLQNTSSVKVATAAFDVTNAANFGTIAPRTPKTPIVAPTTTQQQGLADTFNRANSSTVGNGWVDLNSKFMIAGNRLKVNSLSAQDPNAVLLRPNLVTDSDQTIGIPVQLFDPTKMDVGTYQTSGAWALCSHYQPNGDRYYAEMQYMLTPNQTYAPWMQGQLTFEIGMMLNGTRYSLGFDAGYYLPSTPGHQYSLELKTTGSFPTHLHLIVIDQTTGQQYVVLDQVSDQPEVQMPGQVGIQGSWANNEFSSYSGTLSVVGSSSVVNRP